MIKRNHIVSAIALTSLIPIVAQANLPVTRQSHDVVVMSDNGVNTESYIKTYIPGKTGMNSLDSLTKRLDAEILRSTDSYYEFAMPVNTYCENPFNEFCNEGPNTQDVFPSDKYAKEWIASSFDEDTIFNIEVDLAVAMEETEATRATYRFEDTVRVRNQNAPGGVEERDVSYTISLKKNTYPGFGQKSGVVLSESEYTQNFYIVYNNSSPVSLLDGAVSSPDAGDLIVYEMDNLTPESSSLTEINRFQNTDFDTELLDTPTADFTYKTDGVKAVLEFADNLKKEQSAEIVVVDYKNPISLKRCPIDGSGDCLPTGHSVADPYFKPMINVLTTGRVFYRNVCDNVGVEYTQRNVIEAEVESIIERYVLHSGVEVKNNMTDDELLQLNRVIPFKFDDEQTVNKVFMDTHNFNYNTDISFFNNRLTDFLGENSTAPSNTFSPVCTGEASYEDPACYEFNNLHHDHFEKPLPAVRDDSIVNVNYEEYELIQAETTNLFGTIIPAVYGWVEKDTCDVYNGTNIEDVSSFCSSGGVNCLSVDYK